MSSEGRRQTIEAVLAARYNIALARGWAGDRSLAALQSDTMVRYAIERAFISMDSAIRDIPAAIAEEEGLPARLLAGFRNALAHTYEDVLDERVILTIREDLPRRDAQLAAILQRLGD